MFKGQRDTRNSLEKNKVSNLSTVYTFLVSLETTCEMQLMGEEYKNLKGTQIPMRYTSDFKRSSV